MTDLEKVLAILLIISEALPAFSRLSSNSNWQLFVAVLKLLRGKK